METQARPRTRTAPGRPVAPSPASPAPETARAKRRTRSRTAPAARPENRSALVIPEPFNPYILPADTTALGWARWAGQAAFLSTIATLIWDHGTSIRREIKGSPGLAAPAQWISTFILGMGLFAATGFIDIPWKAIPATVLAVVLLRRVLAADGITLTVKAATYQLARKVVLAAVGIGAWFAAVSLSAWAATAITSLASNPIAKMTAGAQAVEELEAQADAVAANILFYGTCFSGALILLAVYWWFTATNLTAKATAAAQALAEEKASAAEETANV